MQPLSNRWPAPIWARSPLLRLQDMNARLAYLVAALVGLIALAQAGPAQMLNGFELKNSLVPPALRCRQRCRPRSATRRPLTAIAGYEWDQRSAPVPARRKD